MQREKNYRSISLVVLLSVLKVVIVVGKSIYRETGTLLKNVKATFLKEDAINSYFSFSS